jgi:hypothetical protein
MRAVEIVKAWRPSEGFENGRTQLVHAGVYAVPRDLPDDLARRAIAAGAAVVAEARPAVGIQPRWPDETVIVAAPGPSLTPDVAERCRGNRVIAVQDAYRIFPWADVLYGCDAAWWDVHGGCSDFAGEKWSSHGSADHNDKREAAAKYGLHLVQGKDGNGFSTDPAVIHYGSNSGFQAVNLAILFGAGRIVLVGFNMQVVDGKRHFFGDHPKPLSNRTSYRAFVSAFEKAAKSLPAGVEIINATPQSALKCFRSVDLDRALSDSA